MIARRLFRTCFLSAPLLLAACASTGKENTPAAMPDEAMMMANWTAFMTPGPEHAMLGEKVGRWNVVVRMWMDPTQPPVESTGTSEVKWVMGGRYLMESFQGSFMEQPFEGMGLAGYDNMKKKYFGTWIDNMGTGFMMSEGTHDPAGKTISYQGSGPDVMTGTYIPVRSVEHRVDANAMNMEMFMAGPDGKEFKTMELLYTRAN